MRRMAVLTLSLATSILVTTNLYATSWHAYDGGGRIGDYIAYVDNQRSLVEISGICASACTIKLGARQACIRKDAQLWFHAARNPNDGRINALATLMMLSEYPRSIQAWVKQRGALESTGITRMNGAQAIALGVPECR
jgi:hypothetical protein